MSDFVCVYLPCYLFSPSQWGDGIVKKEMEGPKNTNAGTLDYSRLFLAAACFEKYIPLKNINEVNT